MSGEKRLYRISARGVGGSFYQVDAMVVARSETEASELVVNEWKQNGWRDIFVESVTLSAAEGLHPPDKIAHLLIAPEPSP